MLKFKPRPYCTPCFELCFAIALMDFSSAENAIMVSAIPYMYGHPDPAYKSALIQVQHGPWLASQRDKGNAHKALARLVERNVLKQSSKGRYILNTRYAEWQDRSGAIMFEDGNEAHAKLLKLVGIHPLFNGKRADNPGAKPPEKGVTQQPKVLHNTGESGCTTPEKVLHNTNEGGCTTPEKVLHNHNESESGPENAASNGDANSKLLLQEKKQASRADEPALPDAVLAFAREVCRLGGNCHESLQPLHRRLNDLPALIGALERFANTARPPKGEPMAFIAGVAARLADGEALTLPANARTFAVFEKQYHARARLREAVNGKATSPQAATLAELAGTAEALGEKGAAPIRQLAERDARREALADAFTTRDPLHQWAALDEMRRGRLPGALINDLKRWMDAGRPDWRGAPESRLLSGALACAEETARKYLDAQLETVEAKIPEGKLF